MLSQIIVLVILILLNAFFAATEIAFISLNDVKIELKAKEGNKKAKKIEKMLKNPSKFLATIQIGITLAGFLSSAFASDTFANILAPNSYNINHINTIIFYISIWRISSKKNCNEVFRKISIYVSRNNKGNFDNYITIC